MSLSVSTSHHHNTVETRQYEHIFFSFAVRKGAAEINTPTLVRTLHGPVMSLTREALQGMGLSVLETREEPAILSRCKSAEYLLSYLFHYSELRLYRRNF
jgi:hypothetical protein